MNYEKGNIFLSPEILFLSLLLFLLIAKVDWDNIL